MTLTAIVGSLMNFRVAVAASGNWALLMGHAEAKPMQTLPRRLPVGRQGDPEPLFELLAALLGLAGLGGRYQKHHQQAWWYCRASCTRRSSLGRSLSSVEDHDHSAAEAIGAHMKARIRVPQRPLACNA
jgi:hypothetical protein